MFASAVVMATASDCTFYDADSAAAATVTYKNYPPFVYVCVNTMPGYNAVSS